LFKQTNVLVHVGLHSGKL